MKLSKMQKKENRIGILTFHRPLNYGAILQAYALQSAMSDMGISCEIIDYRPKFMELQYYAAINPNVSLLRNFLKLYNYPAKYRKIVQYREFTTKNMTLSKRIYSDEDLKEINQQYDYVFVGSDQVWNPSIINNSYIYFLDGIVPDKKKISYAASMGAACFDEKIINKCINLIRRFSVVSVRENSLSDVLRNNGVQNHTDIDPTLLLTSEQWNSIIFQKRIKNEPYILLYTIAEPVSLYEYAKILADKSGLQLVWITNSRKKQVDAKIIRNCGVEDFLRYIRDAEYVITSSFHCSVFSILFHKKLITETVGKNSVNNRIEDLLNSVEMGDRNISINQDIINSETNWDKTEALLHTLRCNSKKHIINSIGGNGVSD